MLREVQALKPDLILVTGDLVDQESAVVAALELFRGLDAPLGIWAVPGNWDYTARAVGSLTRELASTGGRFLINESAQLEPAFWILGVDDASGWRDRISQAVNDVPTRT